MYELNCKVRSENVDLVPVCNLFSLSEQRGKNYISPTEFPSELKSKKSVYAMTLVVTALALIIIVRKTGSKGVSLSYCGRSAPSIA